MDTNQALVVWLTGLAGSGKSTIGKSLYTKIKTHKPNVVYLDGDELREILGIYDYTRQGRILTAKKRCDIAHFLSKQGIIVVVTTISMFDEIYAYTRERLGNYFEVLIDCPINELIRRNQKSLYTSALEGKIQNVVGIDIPADMPNPHMKIDNTHQNNLEQKTQMIFEAIQHRL